MRVRASPGPLSDGRSYPILLHADWVGCTFADLVFPLFLFLMGVSISLSLSERRRGPIPWQRIIRRSVLLVLFGLGVNAFSLLGAPEDAVLRAEGTLQRIGAVYLLAVPLYLLTMGSTRLLLSATILLVYAVVLESVPFPGIGPSDPWQRNLNFGAWLDLEIFGEQALRTGPDGIPSAHPDAILALPSTMVLTLLGTIAGDWIGRESTHPRRLLVELAGSGLVLMAMGAIWGLAHPIAKPIWTGSYVLYTAGIASLLLAGFHALVDVAGQRWPPIGALEAFGRNSITAYLVHVLAIAVMSVSMRGAYVAMQPTLSGEMASLVVVALPIALVFIPIWWLNRRGRFLRL
jgi:predicted acyltransferase